MALKSKIFVLQNWRNLENCRPFPQFSSKLFDFFWWKIWQIKFFLQAQRFWDRTFFTRMQCLKNGWPLSVPPRAYFYHPQLLKTFFGESWHLTSDKKNLDKLQYCITTVICPGFFESDINRFHQKRIWEFLMKIEGIQALSIPSRSFWNKHVHKVCFIKTDTLYIGSTNIKCVRFYETDFTIQAKQIDLGEIDLLMDFLSFFNQLNSFIAYSIMNMKTTLYGSSN